MPKIPRLPENDLVIIDKPQPQKKPPKSKPKSKKTKVNNKESKEKQVLIYKILKYQDNLRFCHVVRDKLKIKYTNEQLQKKSNKDLEDILNRIRINLDNKNLDEFYNGILKMTTSTLENVVTPFYNIDGFSEMLLEDEQFLDSYERLKIENELPNIPPSLQMMMIISRCVVICHTMNKYKKPQKTMKMPKEDLVIVDQEEKKPPKKKIRKKKKIVGVL